MTYPSQPTTDAEAIAYAAFLTETHGTAYVPYKSASGPNGSYYCALRPEEGKEFEETGWTKVE